MVGIALIAVALIAVSRVRRRFSEKNVAEKEHGEHRITVYAPGATDDTSNETKDGNAPIANQDLPPLHNRDSDNLDIDSSEPGELVEETSKGPPGPTQKPSTPGDHQGFPPSAAEEENNATPGKDKPPSLDSAINEPFDSTAPIPEQTIKNEAEASKNGPQDATDAAIQNTTLTATESGDFLEDQSDAIHGVAEQESPDQEQGNQDLTNAGIEEPRRSPPRYKGLARTQPGKQQGVERSEKREDSSTRDRSLPIEVRLMVERGGFCNISLIARRVSGLSEDIAVKASDGPLELHALQDEWYQDIIPPDISRVLKDGIEWCQEENNDSYRWLLTGRDIYVLAARVDLRGYVSQASLELGREHVVLCTSELCDQVERAIKETGAAPSDILDYSRGVPQGWVVFRGIITKVPIQPIDGPDIFNALRPLARIDISLEEGIRLEYTTWLEGHPPLIRVYGDACHTGEVLIDGKSASFHEEDNYRANGWDSIGSHTVRCGGFSKSYNIVPFAASWEPWAAYEFPLFYRTVRKIAICGPFVLEWSGDKHASRSLLVPETHSIILGAVPGQCFQAVRSAGVRGVPCIASPPFPPVWAIPPDPLRCNKATMRVILVGEPTPPGHSHQQVQKATRSGRTAVDSWCRLILNASRKGLCTEPDAGEIRRLWNSYKSLARRIWRAQK